jgi:hypothetical protein
VSGLVGPDGKPISSSQYQNKKVPPPKTGEKYGTWGGPNVSIVGLPGGGAIQFDLDRLDLGDFRQMRDHYQIASSLSVLTFLLHQMEWRIVCDDKKQADFYTEQIENIWTPLVRSKSQAFWAGYSPNVLQWGNDVPNRRITLDKIKDLFPEDAWVNWKKVDGAGPLKISVYDGIKQFGGPTIPVENCVVSTTPILMEDFTWKKAGDIEAGEVVLAFDENERLKGRRYQLSLVEANRTTDAECVTIESKSGDPITVSKAHPFLVRRGPLLTGDRSTSIYKDRWEWVKAVDLKIGDKIGFFGKPSQRDESREAGYVAGIFDGEGSLSYGGYNNVSLSFTQRSGTVLDETAKILSAKGFEFTITSNKRDDCKQVVIRGGRREIARFMEVFAPERLKAKTTDMFDNTVMRIGRSISVTQVTAIFDAGVQQVSNLQTETSTYISSGYLSHNSYWYPLLMENGNMQGRKLLRSAFQPWFFSILLHLFANRYYERFGEPTPVGRAPYEDEIRFGGEEMRGNEAMSIILQQLRNRSAVVLPNEKTQFGDETTLDYDYQIQYLESQMRGADFERYMTRLDEEMSLALFTPILLMRTADVGSYNLGTQHSIIYQWMLNAIGGDWKYYIDWYILRPLRDFNFGTNAPLPKISFRRMGAQNEDLVRDIVRAMIAKDTVKPDLQQLGEIAGLSLSQVKAVTQPAPAAPANPNDPQPQPGDPTQPSQAGANAKETNRLYATVEQLSERVADQVHNAFRRNKLHEGEFSLGYQRQFENNLTLAGVDYPAMKTKKFFDSVDGILRDMVFMSYRTPESFMIDFRSHAKWLVDRILRDGAKS